jgi:hypothetical protein
MIDGLQLGPEHAAELRIKKARPDLRPGREVDHLRVVGGSGAEIPPFRLAAGPWGVGGCVEPHGEPNSNRAFQIALLKNQGGSLLVIV